ncbi:MAG: SDR family oxidoreductase [Thermoleophilaceae bacterium]
MSRHSDGAVLITGVTGFIGMEVLTRWLERSGRPVYALVRAGDRDAAARRLDSVIDDAVGDPHRYESRATAVCADVEQPALGLPWEEVELLAREVTTIVHCAASVSFTLGLEESRRINVLGTRRVLELAELCRQHGRFDGLTYVSTAYVAGTHAGVFGEEDFDSGQRFRNAYELSKFEAERAIRERAGGLPVQIVRPSIVVGDRKSGWTAAFNVLYTPLKAFARGAYRVIPADYDAPVDVVPVDYVADAIYELASAGGRGTYHVVAGPRATTSLGRIAELASRRFGRRPPRTIPRGLYRRLIHPLALRLTKGRKRRALEQSEVFFPYFSMKVRYDDRRARQRLEPAGIRVSPIERYFDRLIDFAERAHWGKRRLPRRKAQTAGARSTDP